MTTQAERPENQRRVRIQGTGLFSPAAFFQVANGDNSVMITRGTWGDAARLSPDMARKLASILWWQADAAESPAPDPCSSCGQPFASPGCQKSPYMPGAFHTIAGNGGRASQEKS